ncbi:MAG: sulfatase-like hydrolase/transferase [Fuerstiella sp.]|nr:sulfatase-like hydrolase/transferase [Fuerstiella sp.]
MKNLLLCCSFMFCSLAFGEKPNILLLISDDQRPDTIAALGNDLIETPHLDRIVRGGSVFTRATCSNPICTPSRAEILTGSSGFRCGVMDFGKPIDSAIPTMSKWFSAAGYATSYVGKWHNDGKPVERGYHLTRGLYRGGGGKFAIPQVDFAGRPVTGYRGWIFQDDRGNLFPEKGVGLTPEISRHFADAAIETIQSGSDTPFFLHVNFTSPHDPLMLPPGWETTYRADDMKLPANFLPEHPFDHGNFDGRDEKLFARPRTPRETQREIAAYYAVISYMDEQIGRIMAALNDSGKADNTVVIFSSDHGLSVGSHGLRGKQSMYEHTIGVPLLMQGPGIPKATKFDAQCYLRDLFPTLCDLAGIDGPGGQIDGLSLKPVLDGKTEYIHNFVVGYFRNFQRMIRTDEWKYIEYPAVNRQQLFNLKQDPYEQTNMVANEAHAATRDQLKMQMRDWFRNQGDSVYVGTDAEK